MVSFKASRDVCVYKTGLAYADSPPKLGAPDAEIRATETLNIPVEIRLVSISPFSSKLSIDLEICIYTFQSTR